MSIQSYNTSARGYFVSLVYKGLKMCECLSSVIMTFTLVMNSNLEKTKENIEINEDAKASSRCPFWNNLDKDAVQFQKLNKWKIHNEMG